MRGVQEGARPSTRSGRQIIYTAIGIASGLSALQLHVRGEDRLARWPAAAAIVMAVILVLSSIFARPRSRGS